MNAKHLLLLPIALLVVTAACAPASSGIATNDETSLSSPVLLGTAASFSVLGGETVTNTGATSISRDLGVFPGSAVTGAPVVLGASHIADDTARIAQLAVTEAYNDLAGRTCDATMANADLVGLTLVPGVYCFPEGAQLTGALTLDAQGTAGAEFVFLIGSTLTVASSASVQLIGGADPCNVSWKVGSSATVGTDAVMVGNVLALASIALQTRATLVGRALASTGAVTLDTNTITTMDCQVALPTEEDDGDTDAGVIIGEGEGEGSEGEGEGSEGEGEGSEGEGEGEGATEGEGEGEGEDEVELEDGFAICSDVCVDLMTDADNCGACGNVCGDDEQCQSGACCPV